MGGNAKESKHVEQARKKLERRLAVEHLQFTTDALQGIAKKIRSSIQRHHPEFAYLKQRSISLFDENRHTAKAHDKQVLKLEKLLKRGFRTDSARR